MKIIKPVVEIKNQDWSGIFRDIEEKGRVCYKSEDRMTDGSAERFISTLIQLDHLSVVEHASVSVKFTMDRGVSHEIVRHRQGSYSQESTRYCNYGNEKEVTVIEPFFFRNDESKWSAWLSSCQRAEKMYHELLDSGATPQEARSVLPHSLKTELWVTYNLRQWRHFFELRAAKASHLQMRQVVIPLLLKVRNLIPFVFDDIPFDTAFPAKHYAEVKCL